MRIGRVLGIVVITGCIATQAGAKSPRKAAGAPDEEELPCGCPGGTPPGGEGPWRIYRTSAPDTEIGRMFRHNPGSQNDRKWSHYVAPGTGWTWVGPTAGWIVDVNPTAVGTATCTPEAKCQLLDVEAVTLDPYLDLSGDGAAANANTFRSQAYHPTGLYAVTALIHAPGGGVERTEVADLYIVAAGARARRELFCASPGFEWPQADRDDPVATDHRVDWRIDWVDASSPPTFCPPDTVRYEFLLKVQ